MSAVLAAGHWPTNSALIADVARLYIDPADEVLDPTWGRGKWWLDFQPDRLTSHDLFTLDGVDFRQLPEADSSVDVVAFDPPYVAMGGRETSGLVEMGDRYGMITAPRNPEELREMISAGLKECARVLKPKARGYRGGRLLVKCQDYISSGRLQPGTHWMIEDALAAGLDYVDRFEHVTHVRPQPPGRRQVHARRNLSTLLVFMKGRG